MDESDNTESIYQGSSAKRRKRSRRKKPTKLIVLPFEYGESKTSWVAQDFVEFLKKESPESQDDIFSPLMVYLSNGNTPVNVRLNLMLNISEDTTLEDIREAAPLLLQLRDRLLDFQGTGVSGGDAGFYENLSRQKESGTSWAQLAQEINRKVGEWLKEWMEYLNEYERVLHTLKTRNDHILWRSEFNKFSLFHARDILKLMRLTEPEIEGLVNDALEKIRNGKPPFPEGYPIDADEVRATVRSWRSSKLHRYTKPSQ